MTRPRIAIVSRETPSKRHGKSWSEKEIAFLTLNREQWESVAWLAERLGRTTDAVGSKLGRIKLIMQPHRKPKRIVRCIPARRRRADRELAA